MISYGESTSLSEYLLAAPNQASNSQVATADERLRDMPLMQDLAFQVNREVARQVIQRVLEDVAPAEIVSSGDTILANRGLNDGLVVGMEMEVFRLGEEIREAGGREIGHQRTRVGVVRVADVQDTTATLSVVSDGPFRERDRIAMPLVLSETMGDATAREAATPATPAQALGRDAILVERHGDPAAIRPAIAVDSINVTFDGQFQQDQTNTFRLNASRSLSDALQTDPRVVVLPRADLQRLSRERRIAAQAQGQAADPRRGLATSEYFLTGEISVDTNVSRPSVTYEGVSRATGPSRTTLRMRGSYRVTTLDGRSVAAVEVEESGAATNIGERLALIDRLSNEAARTLLADLFPMQVASVDTGRQRVRVTGGANSGLSVNMRLRVYNLGGEPVFDPVTRVMLSAGERNYAGDLIVIDVQPDISTARFAGQAFNVAVGDEVEIAPAPRRAASTTSPAQPQTQSAPETAGPTPF
ncbi:MAG: CsgG/HfaB family protein [Hyphomonadaceae bacterium JAD_PAG50586_4]|nr:MAG: CsgG/HfaB family protein [Hyphomonadaceae bacterium JAD_PAG50586_4]